MPARTLRAALAAAILLGLSGAATADPAALRKGLDSVAARDWATAAASVRGDEIARDIVEWHRLRDGEAETDWQAYRAFLARRADWPGLPYLAEKGERWIPRNADAAAVLDYFRERAPRTGRGALRLAAARAAAGDRAGADAAIVAAWRTLLLDDEEREAFLERHGAVIRPHHEARLDMLLWRGAEKNARAMLPLVSDGWQKLAEARLALREQENGVDARIAAVPAALAGDAGLAYERFLWRARKGRNADAIALALERSGSAQSLGDPERWASWRAVLARWAARQGRAQEAYRLAAGHQLASGEDYAELEWIAGWVALRKLNDPARALAHFQNFRMAVSTPISLGRAGYWEGRAREALGDRAGAQAAYEFGGEHQTSFYGLLAAEKAGLPMDAALAHGGPDFPDWRQTRFAASSVLAAALDLQKAGDRTLSTRFFLHLAESLDAQELGSLSDLALKIGEPYTAVMIAKQAAERNVILPRAYFPVTQLAQANLGIPRELALSIARRESEFNPEVVSPAGARGLMQVMPGTAEDMARKLGIAYSKSRLTADPDYNAQLGGAYLAGLIEEFGQSYVLVAAGYNAGPRRPRAWVEERGHPAAGNVDVIDWIESIPFTETRTYVMRVTESLPIYRARLSGQPQPLALSRELKDR